MNTNESFPQPSLCSFVFICGSFMRLTLRISRPMMLRKESFMSKLAPALAAEFIGTFALCFVGILAIQHSPGLIGVALAHGLILAIMVTAFGTTSGGHFNPAVTIGFLVTGKIKAPDALAYIFAQVLGGFIAGLAVLAILPAVPEVLTT